MTPLTANLLLLLAAAIWGFAFVAQRMGMAHVGPFTFNAIRFGLGSIVLLPLIWGTRTQREHAASRRTLWLGGLLVGLPLFAAASAQQIGIVTTTAGKAGFITGLYVVLVPLAALAWGDRASWVAWVGAFLATAGLYFISVTETFTLSVGDAWVLLSAFLWTVQIHLIARLTRVIDPLPLAAAEFAVCSLLSWAMALAVETISWAGVTGAVWPLAYGSIMSVGVAFTLQVVAQRHAHPTPAAIIMSLESAFAALGGWLLLGERLGARGAIGAAMMMAGMVLAQVRPPAPLAHPGESAR
ncbi:MAG: DMT family transporter [Anaerolineae bacterium]|jgi:drug/metabolite transporter (DMT)-like permease|nr:DMT family transporter [Anaerolineae bacterium]